MEEATRHKTKHIIQNDSVLRGDFKLSSGEKTAYFIKMLNTLNNPLGLGHTLRLLEGEILERTGYIDAVGGIALGGAPLVYGFLALYPGFFGLIVRTDTKDYGAKNPVETSPHLVRGAKVVLLDDVLATGESLLKGNRLIKEAGFEVVKAIVVADRQQGGMEACEEEGLHVVSLFKVEELL